MCGTDSGRRCEYREVPKTGTERNKRKELDIPPDGFHIVSVGELVENKNHAVVIEAVARLHDENIYYSICGKGPYRETLEHLIQKHHLEKQVRLLGYRNDVQDVLQSADCFAFPSKREGLGIAAIEALACEVPVIASDNRGSRSTCAIRKMALSVRQIKWQISCMRSAV